MPPAMAIRTSAVRPWSLPSDSGPSTVTVPTFCVPLVSGALSMRSGPASESTVRRRAERARRQGAETLQLNQRRGTVAGAELARADLQDHQVPVTARVYGEVALRGHVDLRGGGGTVGAGGGRQLLGQPEPHLVELLLQHPVDLLAVADLDQLLGQQRGDDQGQGHHHHGDRGDADVEGVPHRVTTR